MNLATFISRVWFYFRMGYSTYLTFLLGYVSTLVTVYYLAIKNLPYLLNWFPKFESFIVFATLIGVPLCVGIGWVHLKRSSLYSSEVDIGVESNPYYTKLTPGKEQEALYPTLLVLLRALRAEHDTPELAGLDCKLESLISGNHVGKQRRST